MKKNRLAITMGDPAGVGPEIIIKTYSTLKDAPQTCIPFVIGSREVLSHYARLIGFAGEITTIRESEISSIPEGFHTIYVLEPMDVPSLDIEQYMGTVHEIPGKASFLYVAKAIQSALAGDIDGIVTAPISKTAWHMAGITFPGHTEMLAHYSGTKDFAMMMVAEKLRVVLATIHIPLLEVPHSISREGLLRLFSLVDSFMPYCGIKGKARIGVCGLNPHAGEEGLLGAEEQDIIEPAIHSSRLQGMNISGAFPGDTIYNRMLEGEFDVIIAMYHDQALIPIKTLDFYGGVNVTVGLPFIRTSVDHGTAFGIAGKGMARADSLIHAINLCGEYVDNKNRLSEKG